MPRKLKTRTRRRFIELTETINAIPKGVYQVLRRDEHGVLFSIGHKIHIGVIGDIEHYLRPLPPMEGKRRQFRQEEFLDQYYELLKLLKNTPPDYSRPFTFCGLDPSLEREFH